MARIETSAFKEVPALFLFLKQKCLGVVRDRHTGEGIETECQDWLPCLLLLGTACCPRSSPVSVLNAWYI